MKTIRLTRIANARKYTIIDKNGNQDGVKLEGLGELSYRAFLTGDSVTRNCGIYVLNDVKKRPSAVSLTAPRTISVASVTA